jgi:hypothetical protein
LLHLHKFLECFVATQDTFIAPHHRILFAGVVALRREKTALDLLPVMIDGRPSSFISRRFDGGCGLWRERGRSDPPFALQRTSSEQKAPAR